MAEGAAAFAIAGNVLQFVEFATKFSNKCLEIHRAGGSAPGDLQSLRFLVDSQQSTLQRLRVPDSEHSKISLEHVEVANVAEACYERFADISKSLDRIGITNGKTVRSVVLNAFKATWNQDKIEALRNEVASFSQSLNTSLLHSLREYAAKSEEQQIAILEKLDIIQDNTGTLTSTSIVEGQEASWNAPGDAVIAFIVRSLDAEPEEREKSAMELRQGILQRILLNTSSRVNHSEEVGPPSINLPRDREKQLQATILASFVYDVMDDRHSRIIDAHEETFRWIFEHPKEDPGKWSDFKDWLKSDDQLYWITGKAGSGKSTLMKFICSSAPENLSANAMDPDASSNNQLERCRHDLLDWAGSRPLLIASFYLWASGNELEASPKGLYMSLIFQILQHCPEMIPRVAPLWWEALSLFDDKPSQMTEVELEAMLRLVVIEAQKERNICLFIDGLDEFSGKPKELIALIKFILECPNVKVCVSSRPWVVFEDAFEHEPSLKLEDLTYKDIKGFIAKNFAEDPGFARLARREPNYASQLEDRIATKAAGVFLWVSMVVRSLLSGMGNDDRVSDMQRRLDQLPQELETLYSTMLDSLEGFYFEHAAQYFLLVEAWKTSPPAVLFDFADEEVGYPIKLRVRECSQDEIRERAETARRRINSRCRGLLEVTSPSSAAKGVEGFGTVQYLHKTVRDYILSPAIDERIKAARPDFDSHLRICSAYLSAFKTVVIQDRHQPFRGRLPSGKSTGKSSDDTTAECDEELERNMSNFAACCLQSASKVKKENTAIMVDLLDSLRDSSARMIGDDEKRQARFYRSVSRSEGLGNWYNTKAGSGFLSLAVRLGAVNYVEKKVSPGCLVPRASFESIKKFEMSPVLRFRQLIGDTSKSDATHVSNDERHLYWPLLIDALHHIPPRLEMVRLCLEKGADPNFQLHGNGSTIWTEWIADMMLRIAVVKEKGSILDITRERMKECLTPRWDATQLLIEHGARVDSHALALARARWAYLKTQLSDREAKRFGEMLLRKTQDRSYDSNHAQAAMLVN
ncbi:hypothetical protein CNYM01_03796 [Colletotrichum nymphaeae SA-01]|uniref:NACHT domain-containing protein n=1 Tax=Colletotrichum nymphaeae SA-01 TaxID=1460502 RepID=A0A135T3P0_9PEZI|nr:hypothetical protein CNYM01_03796 [Colletotrichum nymphaeae SA-01]